MTTTPDDDTTPQQRLDANPELLAQISDSMARGREGSVPRKPRGDRLPATVALEDEAEKAPAPSAYDFVPPELRPHRW